MLPSSYVERHTQPVALPAHVAYVYVSVPVPVAYGPPYVLLGRTALGAPSASPKQTSPPPPRFLTSSPLTRGCGASLCRRHQRAGLGGGGGGRSSVTGPSLPRRRVRVPRRRPDIKVRVPVFSVFNFGLMGLLHPSQSGFTARFVVQQLYLVRFSLSSRFAFSEVLHLAGNAAEARTSVGATSAARRKGHSHCFPHAQIPSAAASPRGRRMLRASPILPPRLH